MTQFILLSYSSGKICCPQTPPPPHTHTRTHTHTLPAKCKAKSRW